MNAEALCRSASPAGATGSRFFFSLLTVSFRDAIPNCPNCSTLDVCYSRFIQHVCMRHVEMAMARFSSQTMW